MISETWAWMHLPGELTPTLCGVLRHDGRVGRFVYGRNYLSNATAVPIDPIALPLRANEFETTHLNGWFSALLDAGPDAWGKRIIDRNAGPQDQRGYLLRSYGHPVGALTFSATKEEPPTAAMVTTTQTLEETLALHARVEAGEPLNAEESAQLLGEAGTGGARPKLTIEAEGCLWLAKGVSVNDKTDMAPVPIVEATLLTLASELNINSPEVRLKTIAGNPVVMVKRFDRQAESGGGYSRWRYASARTLFWSAPEVAQWSYGGSYANLARRISIWESAPKKDVQELYRRIVFNALVGNLDDHDKNHGLIAGSDGSFSLSPVFDLSITATVGSRHELAMSFGKDGSRISLNNLLSECDAFQYSASGAEQLIRMQWAHLQEHALARLLSFGCDEQRAERTLMLMPGHRMLADMQHGQAAAPIRRPKIG